MARKDLNVRGNAFSKKPSVPSSRCSSQSFSDDDSQDVFSALTGLREMNQMLEQKIDVLRLKIKIDEKNYSNEKTLLTEQKDLEIEAKNSEIDGLKEVLLKKDDRILHLTKNSKAAETELQKKTLEIQDLKTMVQQITNQARKFQNQFLKAKDQNGTASSGPQALADEDKEKLLEEMETLKSKLARVEQELAQAMKVIEQQNQQIKKMDEDQLRLQNTFKEELNKATRAMKQEVARVREVMYQNHQVMAKLLEENQLAHREFRDLLNTPRHSSTDLAATPGTHSAANSPATTPPSPSPASQRLVPSQSPLPAIDAAHHKLNPSNNRLQVPASDPHPGKSSGSLGPSPRTRTSSPSRVSSAFRMSPDLASRQVEKTTTQRNQNTVAVGQTTSYYNQQTNKDSKKLPVCSIKGVEQVPLAVKQVSGRGGKVFKKLPLKK